MSDLDFKTVPVIREGCGREDRGYLFSFGAYGGTYVAIIGGSLEDALENCEEWLDDNAPGLLGTVGPEDYAEAAKDLGVEWPSDDDEICSKVQEAAEADMTMVGHTTLKNGNCIPSWEWTARDLDAAELAILMRRFCKDCTSELGEKDSTLCAGCVEFLVDRVASDLRIERAGLDAADFPEEDENGESVSCDVRLQVSRWGSDWAIRVGDASYDQDHRGDWGASSIRPDDSDEAIRGTAEALVDQALESAAMRVLEEE